MIPRALTATILLSLAVSLPAQAGVILQPVDAATNMGSFPGAWAPGNTITQSGLSAGYVSGVTDFDAYVTSTTALTLPGDAWFSADGVYTGNFEIGLGGLFNVTSLALWADHQDVGLGVQNFNLYADDNAAFTSPTLLGSFIAADGTGSHLTNFGQVFEFAPILASHLRLEILSNWGGTCCTGINELAVEVTQVPEPTTLFLFGTAAAAFFGHARRRRRT